MSRHSYLYGINPNRLLIQPRNIDKKSGPGVIWPWLHLKKRLNETVGLRNFMEPVKTRITLVRTGRVHNPDRIIYGRLPRFTMSEQGWEEARKTAGVLRNQKFSAVFTSPLLRARETAGEILKFHRKLPLKSSVNITDVLVSFQGEPENELARFNNDRYVRRTFGCEQPHEVLARVMRFISRVRKRFRGEHVAAVTHGDVILFLMFWALGYGVTAKNRRNLGQLDRIREYPATGSVTTLLFEEDPDPEADCPDKPPMISYFNPGFHPAKLFRKRKVPIPGEILQPPEPAGD